MSTVVVYETFPGGITISTVKLRFYHRDEAYETMVFRQGSGGGELDMKRYMTKAEARTGHSELVTKYSVIANLASQNQS